MKKNIESKAAATITGEAEKVTIRVNNPTWQHRLGLKPKFRAFEIKPTTLGNLTRISSLLLELDYNPENPDMWGESLNAAKHGHCMAMIIALAVTNKKEMPSRAVVDFMLYNLTAKELLQVLFVVIKQLDLKSFMSSIISVRGVSLIKTGSQIAPITNGNLLEE